MAGIGKIFQMAGVNSDPRTARKAGRDARRVLPASKKTPTENSLGSAATVTLSPEAKAILAKKKGDSSGSDVALPVVAASCALGLSRVFKRKGNKA